ncbi:MAG: LamG domain-containing protein, partial [Bryobacterales bacterium]|nr:LamG domain-containing protein [Bryobacterales bacterium]
PHLWRGLVGAWPLQEPGGATAFDVSGYGQHGILANTETQDRVIRSQGRSIILDGVDESIEITQAAHLKPTAAISVSAWIHRLSGPTNYDGIFKGPSEGAKNTYMLVWYSDGFRWIIYDIAASQKYCLSNGQAPTTNEVHVVGTWDV